VASDSLTFSFATSLSTKRQQLEKRGVCRLIKRQPTDNKTSSSTNGYEKLEEARAIIERWESGNNKLMERLQQKIIVDILASDVK
jgi:hypothetical protein